MACSVLDRVKSDLRRNNLTDKNLKAPVSKEKEITKYVLNLTRIAKSKYNVDLGNMFTIRKTNSQISLEANIPAFDAVEKSQEYESDEIYQEAKDKTLSLDKNKVAEDVATTDQGIKSEPTNIVEPKGLPSLEITC